MASGDVKKAAFKGPAASLPKETRDSRGRRTRLRAVDGQVVNPANGPVQGPARVSWQGPARAAIDGFGRLDLSWKARKAPRNKA
jgi:hypothetical protein